MRLYTSFAPFSSYVSTTILSLSIGMASLSCQAQSTSAEESLSIAGFDQPESVEVDSELGYLYVSNIAGHPLEEDGIGYISKVRPDGSALELKWVEGLDAPKGLTLYQGRLYVADIKSLVVIDVKQGQIIARYPAPEGRLLNGIAVSEQGVVYVSDFLGNHLYRLINGRLELWLQGESLDTPNGLSIRGDQLTLVTWGRDIHEDFSTDFPGYILQGSLSDGKLQPMANSPRGNWDGVVDTGHGWLVSNWLTGEVVEVFANGISNKILQLAPGSADLAWDSAANTLWVPEMQLGRVTGYRISQ